MMHGFLSSSAQWMHNLQALSAVCRPVTIDLWGHGASPAPSDPAYYHPTAYIEALERIRRDLGAEQWFVCGYSISAGITIRYTHTYPEYVAAHLFTNSASGFAPAELVASWRADAEPGAVRIEQGGADAIERIPVHPRFAKRLPQDISQALVADAVRLSPIGIANTLRQTTTNASIRDIASANPRPALLCHGNKEKRFAESKDWATRNMAQLCVADLEAGHAVNMEDSAGFNVAVAEFITQHTP
jgi:2-succinyl-6-hydroxy-2,4-cyclohexadiene-1-carboxylate synthase